MAGPSTQLLPPGAAGTRCRAFVTGSLPSCSVQRTASTLQPSRQRAGQKRAAHIRGLSLRVQAAAAVEERTGYKTVLRETCKAYKGAAVQLRKGQFIKVINTPGTQVVDFWAMNTDNADGSYLREVMSMHHSHDNIGKLVPQVGDVMVTSRRKPILTMMEDTGPGVHDTLVAACDHHLYEQELGISPQDPHDNCTNNLHVSLGKIGWKLTDNPDTYLTPGPFNLWMHVPFSGIEQRGTPKGSTGKLDTWWAPPADGQKPGDYVVMRAEMNCVCVMSACPSDDICPINGPDGTQDVHYEVLEQA